MFAVLDACFSGTTPYGEDLNIPTEAPDPASFEHERLSVLLPNSTKSCQGEVPRLRRLPFSYFALGALKGWGDVDFDGDIDQDDCDLAFEAAGDGECPDLGE